jgi:hypothetical protein
VTVGLCVESATRAPSAGGSIELRPTYTTGKFLIPGLRNSKSKGPEVGKITEHFREQPGGPCASGKQWKVTKTWLWGRTGGIVQGLKLRESLGISPRTRGWPSRVNSRELS